MITFVSEYSLTTMTNRQYEIIQAAGIVLTRSGISGLTIKNIAHQMDFSESAIYRHFTSKEKIVIAMLEYLAVNMEERCQKEIRSDRNADKNLLSIFQNQIDYFKAHTYFVSVVFSDGLLEESERINEKIIDVMKVKHNLLYQVIEQGKDQSILNDDMETDIIVDIIMGSFRLQMYRWKASGFTLDIDSKVNVILRQMIQFIK